jgi:hypothetical protein
MNIVQFAGGTFVDSEDFSNKTQIDPAPVVVIEGNASVDESPADGATENNVTFIARDADDSPCAAYLEFTCDSGTAVLGATTAATDWETGEVTISLTDTVEEIVTVTAKSAGSDVVGTAEATFLAVGGGGVGETGRGIHRPGKARPGSGDYPINETEEQREKRLEREGRDKEFLKKRDDETDDEYKRRIAKDRESRQPPQSGGRANPSSPASGSRDKTNLPSDIDPAVAVKKSPPAAGSLSDSDSGVKSAVAKDTTPKK